MLLSVFSKSKKDKIRQLHSGVSPIYLPNCKKKKLKTKRNNGQAIVEYVLILAVVVVVMGGLLLKLNKGFENWGKSILGADGYIACLMQTGLLPGQTASISGACSIAQMNPDFSSSSGSSSSGSSSSGSSSSGSSSSGSSSSGSSSSGSSSGDSVSKGGGSTPSDNSEIPDSSNEYPSNSSSSSELGSNRSSKSKRKAHSPNGQLISLNSSEGFMDDKENAAGQSTTETGGGSRRKKKKMGFRDGFTSNSNSGHPGKRFRAIGSYGTMEADQEERKRRNTPIFVSNSSAKKKTDYKERKNRLIRKEKLKKTTNDIKIGKWSFGNIFRIILIICIIAAIVLLIGSQTMQVKKSMK